MNVGFSSLYFSRMPLVKQIYAYELFPETLKIAKDNIHLNKTYQNKINVFDFGLSNNNTIKEIVFSIK